MKFKIHLGHLNMPIVPDCGIYLEIPEFNKFRYYLKFIYNNGYIIHSVNDYKCTECNVFRSIIQAAKIMARLQQGYELSESSILNLIEDGFLKNEISKNETSTDITPTNK